MSYPIRQGDTTSHGGAVQFAPLSPNDHCCQPLACVGDVCTCPVPGHTQCVIVEGDPHWSINGRAVALHGHRTSCGAMLIASLGRD